MKTFENREMLSALENANSILLCTHLNPDGDAAGSTLAMAHALRAMGKSVTCACQDAMPAYAQILPGAGDFKRSDGLTGMRFDAALALDAAELSRLGACAEAFTQAPVRMQIDHHPTNPLYAQMNEVDDKAPAASCIVFRALKAMNAAITPEIASCLYCGISTDTGNFCFPGTDSETFSIIAALTDAGLPLPDLARNIHRVREISHVKLLGRALSTLHFFGGGKCSGMRLGLKDFAAAEALTEHSSRIVNYGIDLPGVQMTYLAMQTEEGFTECSLRALPGYDVSVIARKFGGGGHVLAAGLRCEAELDDLCAQIEAEMLRQLESKA